jgi:pimeloyl-ACP methyl ester carboxylesterase
MWNYGTSLVSLGCKAEGKFALITHGWNSDPSIWMARLSQKLLKYRGGCIILMDWTKYASNLNYPSVVMNDYKKVSGAVTRRLISLQADGVSPNNIFMYGHSLGARIVVDAAITFGPGQIGEIDGE